MDEPILAGLSVTITPAFSSAATLSNAAPYSSDFRMHEVCEPQLLTLATRDNGTGMTHTAPWWCSTTRNEANNRLRILPCLVELFQVFRSFLFHRPTNLSDDDDA